MKESNSADATVEQTAKRQQFLWEGIALWCTSGSAPGELRGVVGSEVLEHHTYDGMLDLMRRMERMLDRMQTPPQTHQVRQFAHTRRQRDALQRRQTMMISRDEATIVPQPVAQPTFVVHVRFRQNATWQGSVKWVEARETRNFRSAWELMHLMEEALDTTADGTMATWAREEDSLEELSTAQKDAPDQA